jgi:hypothetical protein
MSKLDHEGKRLLRDIVRDVKTLGFASVMEMKDKPIEIDGVRFSGSKAWVIVLQDPAPKR